jgi:hypothetical protein
LFSILCDLNDEMRRVFGDMPVHSKFTVFVDSRRCGPYGNFRNVTELF